MKKIPPHTAPLPAMLCLLVFYFVLPACQAQFRPKEKVYEATYDDSVAEFSRFLRISPTELVKQNSLFKDGIIRSDHIDVTSSKAFNAQLNVYIATHNNTLERYSLFLGISEEQLREQNPKLRDGRVDEGDTIRLGSAPGVVRRPDPTVPAQNPPGPVAPSSVSASPPTNEPEADIVKILREDKSIGYSLIEYKRHKYSVFEVDPKHSLFDLFNKSEDGQMYTFPLVEQSLKGRLVFAMNAGMFDRNYDPVGLFIQNGRLLADINIDKAPDGNFFMLPNGIFMVDEKNMPRVISTPEYVKNIKPLPAGKVRLATQSGPMLVINNNYHPIFQKASHNINLRNGVGVTKNNTVFFVLSEEEVNFYELAELFKSYLKCPNALYLDGFISQAFAPKYGTKGILGNKRARLGTIIAISKP